MTQFYSGLLDFAGETLTVQRLAINAHLAVLDATLTWNGAPWSYQARGQALPGSAGTFIFRAHCRDLSSGKPGYTSPIESTLRLQVTFEDSELDVKGVWQEGNDPELYEVGGLLELMSKQP